MDTPNKFQNGYYNPLCSHVETTAQRDYLPYLYCCLLFYPLDNLIICEISNTTFMLGMRMQKSCLPQSCKWIIKVNGDRVKVERFLIPSLLLSQHYSVLPLTVLFSTGNWERLPQWPLQEVCVPRATQLSAQPRVGAGLAAVHRTAPPLAPRCWDLQQAACLGVKITPHHSTLPATSVLET